MLFIEIIVTVLFYLFLPFYYIERLVHKKSYGWKEKFGGIKALNDDKVIHIHCCSVGEALAIENLLKSIRKEFSDYKIVVTTFTYAGQEIAKKKYSEIADYVTYLPFDIPMCVNKFLSKIHPKISIIVETEIWPFFALGCKKRNIPLCIINARISDSSYGQYKLLRVLFSKILKNYKAVYAQSLEDMNKFISIGMSKDNVEMMGNLKFDVEKSEDNVDIGQNGYKIFLAGSTHRPENEIIINTYKSLKEQIKGLKLLIAPRHLERVAEIVDMLQKVGLSYELRSNNGRFSENIDVIVLNTLGELKKMYSICYVAFIGGSFNKTGGHNPLEAAIYEKPVVSGPSIFNFKDIYDILSKSGAGKVVINQKELQEYLYKLLSSQQEYDRVKSSCKKVFDTQRGAVNFVVDKVREILASDND